MEVVVTTGAIRRAKLQSNRQHQHQTFTGHMPFLSPSRQCQSTEGRSYEQYKVSSSRALKELTLYFFYNFCHKIFTDITDRMLFKNANPVCT